MAPPKIPSVKFLFITQTLALKFCHPQGGYSSLSEGIALCVQVVWTVSGAGADAR